VNRRITQRHETASSGFQHLPFAVRWLTLGTGLVVITLVGVAFWVNLVGEPFGDWNWTILAFVLVIAETLILGSIAAANGPYEQRLRRWDSNDFGEDA